MSDDYDDDIDSPFIDCALCDKKIIFMDSWAPGDDAICSECDTEVTGRIHPPSLPATQEALEKLIKERVE